MKSLIENEREWLHADGRVDEYLRLGEKALREGKWDKALAYATMARAWQRERDDARAGLP